MSQYVVGESEVYEVHRMMDDSPRSGLHETGSWTSGAPGQAHVAWNLLGPWTTRQAGV